MDFNWTILSIAAFIPMLVSPLWYHKKTFGKYVFLDVPNSSSNNQMSRKILMLVVTYVLCLLLSSAIMGSVVHQFAVYGALEGSPGLGDAGTNVQNYLEDFFRKYGNNHRNFSHGAFHGALTAITFALPLIGFNGFREGWKWQSIWTHFGFWLVSITLMGGIICHFL